MTTTLKKRGPMVTTLKKRGPMTTKKVVIGRGGHGEVYYLSENPNIAYKQTHKECKNLKKEYTNWSKAYRKYIDYTSGKNRHIRDIGHIPRPSNWDRNNSGCVFQLARVKPIEGKYTWQAYIGEVDEPNMDKNVTSNNAIRGRYMGPETLSKYFDVNSLAYTAGILIGIVQYGAHLNGLDVELVLGKTNNNDDPNIFLIDFDQTETWGSTGTAKTWGSTDKKEEKRIVSELSWTLIAEPYFPNINSKYHSHFVKGYYEVADYYGYLNLAEKVIVDMEDI